MSELTWAEAKANGSVHYKTKDIEPIDLYKAGHMFQDFALANIIKYAFRNRSSLSVHMNKRDLDKIIHYAELLKSCVD